MGLTATAPVLFVVGGHSRVQLLSTAPRMAELHVDHDIIDFTGLIAVLQHYQLVSAQLGEFDTFFYMHDTCTVDQQFRTLLTGWRLQRTCGLMYGQSKNMGMCMSYSMEIDMCMSMSTCTCTCACTCPIACLIISLARSLKPWSPDPLTIVIHGALPEVVTRFGYMAG